ncbi:META domain-containing protein [Polaribacter sp.]|uniref:META domain-containing protein n=1 Tax=Polaribacter sp. TaxID=1920175 RepID=UPI003EF0F444
MKVKLIAINLILITIMSCSSVKKQQEDSFDTAITGKYWKLKTLQGKVVKMDKNQERDIFISLKKHDNSIKGFTGCNSIAGQFTLKEGNSITIGKLAVTQRFCPNIDESTFLKVLNLADNYTVKDDVLQLNVGRRAPLAVFEAVYFN